MQVGELCFVLNAFHAASLCDGDIRDEQQEACKSENGDDDQEILVIVDDIQSERCGLPPARIRHLHHDLRHHLLLPVKPAQLSRLVVEGHSRGNRVDGEEELRSDHGRRDGHELLARDHEGGVRVLEGGGRDGAAVVHLS